MKKVYTLTFNKLDCCKITTKHEVIMSLPQNNNPRVGVGVLLVENDKLLLGKRKNSHGNGTWAPPGGHLEFGESFEECAIREVLEETGLNIKNPEFLAITNDFFQKENRHYVSVFMRVEYPKGQAVKNM